MAKKQLPFIFILTFGALIIKLDALRGARVVSADLARHHVNLRLNTTHICGATLVSDTWLLTAAHCLYGDMESSWLTVTPPGEDRQTATRGVEEFIIHEDFNVYNLDNDIALLKVSEPYNFTAELVRPLELVPEKYDFAPGSLAQISGFGPAAHWGALRAANATLITHDDCAMEYHQIGLTDSVICARATASDVELEGGDGGGALVSRGRCAGVASLQLHRRAAVYTRIAAPRVRAFIQTHTRL